jgi:hypothetical protein
VIGAELEDLANKSGRLIPEFIETAIEYISNNGLGTEGIFRISAKKAELDVLTAQLEQGKTIDWIECESAYTPAAMIKEFLRELPTPLLGNEHTFKQWLATDDLSDELFTKQALSLLQSLPLSHQYLFAQLMGLCQKIIEKSQVSALHFFLNLLCFLDFNVFVIIMFA